MLTIWEKPLNISSMNTKQRLTNIERNQIKLTNRLKSILVGILLSDGWISKNNKWNPRIGFKQSIIHFNYFWFIFNEISILCSNFPYLTVTTCRGKLFYAFQIETRQLQCFNEIYNLFYVHNEDAHIKGEADKRVERIKPELIHYLDYLALAHWLMGDGSKKNKGVTLCTDGFTLKEVIILINILIINFKINPTIGENDKKRSFLPFHKEKNNYRIYINKKDLDKIYNHIKPHFVDSFLYKIFTDVKH